MAIMANAFDVGGVGANLVPQLNPNIGALANVVGSTIDDPITNDVFELLEQMDIGHLLRQDAFWTLMQS